MRAKPVQRQFPWFAASACGWTALLPWACLALLAAALQAPKQPSQVHLTSAKKINVELAGRSMGRASLEALQNQSDAPAPTSKTPASALILSRGIPVPILNSTRRKRDAGSDPSKTIAPPTGLRVVEVFNRGDEQ